MTRNVIRLLALGAVSLIAAATEVTAQTADSGPLSIGRQGYLFAGGTYATVNGRRVLSGHLYAEFQIPSRQTHPWPIVMVHGGGQSGTNFTGTPDGREGWAQFFLRQGYAVYVVDQPGRGRAAYEADVYGKATQLNPDTTQQRFVAPERYNLWPQAHLHTQWPGQGAPGDPVFDQFFASQLPSIEDFTEQQALNRDALVALLDKIGPAILLTHSQSGAFGMLAAKDAGAYASEPHHVADPHRDVRGVVPRLLRSLHGEIPAAGRRAAHLDQARGCGDPRQWAHDDARKKQHGNRGGDGAVAWR